MATRRNPRSGTQPASRAEHDERLELGVGQLVAGLNGLLKQRVGRVYVVGEISNLHSAASGHSYFTLKDEEGQMRAALFRGNAGRLRFELEEGLEVVADSEVSIYAARGDLQLVVRGLEPRGVGALQLAFEQLRRRLDAAGYFAEERKRDLPTYPRRIGVVTSPTSAAVRDVLKVAGRRFPATPILISPTLVQGDEAPEQVAAAIERVAQMEEIDVVLVVRGGGSIEDLWAFNTEEVARAIFNCPVPVIAGVGHETDLTIADLVADVRAPTPSAAAMVALPDRDALSGLIARDTRRLVSAALGRTEAYAARIGRLRAVLHARSPQVRVALARTREAKARAAAETAIRTRIERARRRLGASAVGLDALSPLAVLGRGYALARRSGKGGILRDAREAALGETLELQLASGRLEAEVTRIDPGEPASPSSAAASGSSKARPSGESS